MLLAALLYAGALLAKSSAASHLNIKDVVRKHCKPDMTLRACRQALKPINWHLARTMTVCSPDGRGPIQEIDMLGSNLLTLYKVIDYSFIHPVEYDIITCPLVTNTMVERALNGVVNRNLNYTVHSIDPDSKRIVVSQVNHQLFVPFNQDPLKLVCIPPNKTIMTSRIIQQASEELFCDRNGKETFSKTNLRARDSTVLINVNGFLFTAKVKACPKTKREVMEEKVKKLFGLYNKLENDTFYYDSLEPFLWVNHYFLCHWCILMGAIAVIMIVNTILALAVAFNYRSRVE